MKNWFKKYSSFLEVNKDPMAFDSSLDSLQTVFTNNKNNDKQRYKTKKVYQLGTYRVMTNKELDKEE